MTLNNKIINPLFQRMIFNGKSKKPKYFWSLTDNNFQIIDHKNRIAYSVRDLGLGHFDNINRPAYTVLGIYYLKIRKIRFSLD